MGTINSPMNMPAGMLSIAGGLGAGAGMPVTEGSGVATTNSAGAGTLATRGLRMATAGLMSASTGTEATAVGGSVTPGVGVAPPRWIRVAGTTGADILLRGGRAAAGRGYAHAYYVHQLREGREILDTMIIIIILGHPDSYCNECSMPI